MGKTTLAGRSSIAKTFIQNVVTLSKYLSAKKKAYHFHSLILGLEIFEI